MSLSPTVTCLCRYANSLIVLSPIHTSEHIKGLISTIEWALTNPETRIALILDDEIEPAQCAESESGDANLTCTALPPYDSRELNNAVQYVISSFADTDPTKCLTVIAKVSW